MAVLSPSVPRRERRFSSAFRAFGDSGEKFAFLGRTVRAGIPRGGDLGFGNTEFRFSNGHPFQVLVSVEHTCHGISPISEGSPVNSTIRLYR